MKMNWSLATRRIIRFTEIWDGIAAERLCFLYTNSACFFSFSISTALYLSVCF